MYIGLKEYYILGLKMAVTSATWDFDLECLFEDLVNTLWYFWKKIGDV